jgi:Outer membrane receptor for ferrienterochelin and colicins
MSGNWLKASVIGLGLALFPFVGVTAQGDDSKSSTTKLDTVVVTASRTEEKLRDVSANVTVIGQEELQKYPEQRLDQILIREGFHIVSYPGQDSAQIMIRGFKNSSYQTDGGLGGDILLLVDGRLSGVSNIARLTKTNVERIEIIRGPAALQYGASALGGAINIITRRGEGDFSAHLQVGLGSSSFYDQLIGFDGRKGSFDYSVDFYRSTIGEFTDGKGRNNYGTGDEGIYSGSFNLGYNFLDDRHRIGLTVSGFENKDQGIGNGIADGPSNRLNATTSHLELSNRAYDLNYTGSDESGFLSWQARYFHTSEWRKYNYDPNPNRADPNAYTFGPYDTSIDGFQGQLSAKWDWVELTAGFDRTKFSTEDYGKNYAPTSKVSHTNTAGFLIGKMRFFDDKLIPNAGVRYDVYDIDIEGKPSTTLTNWTPSIGLAYLPLEWLKLRANYAEGFHLPSPNQLTRDSIGTNPAVRYLGNPDLDPFTTKSYELGADLVHTNWDAHLTYFHSRYQGQVRSQLSGAFDNAGRPVERFYNASEPTTYAGIEFGGTFNIGRQFGWKFDLKPYVKATHFTTRRAWHESSHQYVTDTDMPEWLLAYGMDFNYPEWNLSANINATYVGEARVTNYSRVNRPGIGYGDTFNADTYTLVDVTLTKRLMDFGDEKHQLSLNVAIRNVFDQYYESIVDYPGPGRNFYIGLRYDFN